MTLAIGTPSYGSKKKNNWRIKDGDNVYRILPPLGKLASSGAWAVFEALHWGYKGSKGMRPFRCIQKKNFKTKMITVQCPECDKISEYKLAEETAKEEKKAEGMSDADVKLAIQPLTDWLFSHNLDKKWYVNAMTQDGQIGRLAIPHKAYQALQTRIEKLLTEDGIDPLAVEGGVWFNFNRTGKGNQTAHSVDVVMTMEDIGGGRKAKVIKPAPLTSDVLARISAEAYDLKDSFRTLTYDEIKRIVDSGGDPEEVDHVFSSPDNDGGDSGGDDEPEAGATASTNAMLVSRPAPKTTESVRSNPKPPVQPRIEEQAEVDIEAALRAEFEAKLAAAKANRAGAAATNSEAPTSSKEMSDEEFIAKFGFSGKK